MNGRRPPTPPGHRSLGYCGEGNYRCECGVIFATLADTALRMGAGDTAYQAITDQWVAHYTKEAA